MLHPAAFLAAGFLLLALGIATGLARLGWPVPAPPVGLHGPLMINGFFGTLLSFERSRCLGQRWLLIAPAASVLGTALLLTGASPVTGMILLTAAGLLLLLALLGSLAERRSCSQILLTCGACSWLAGNLLWLAGWPLATVVWWWRGLLLLSIAGDRMALAGLEPPSRWRQMIWYLLIYLFVIALFAQLWLPALGAALVGVFMVLLALGLMLSDRTARLGLHWPGRDRFTAVGVLSAYGWLFLGGIAVVATTAVTPAMGLGTIEWMAFCLAAGPLYDAALHCAFLGFAVGMVFAHAPLVFPRLLSRPFDYSDRFWAHWLLLQVSLILRLLGDVTDIEPLRRWGALGNALAVLLFGLSTLLAFRPRPPCREIFPKV